MFTSLYVKTTLALENFKKDQRGVTAIEYAVIGVAMSGIVFAVFAKDGTLDKALTDAMTTISNNMSGKTTP